MRGRDRQTVLRGTDRQRGGEKHTQIRERAE